MEYVGSDLGKTSSQLCVLTADGELIERRIKTTREQLDTWLGSRPPARILIEATTESEWVAVEGREASGAATSSNTTTRRRESPALVGREQKGEGNSLGAKVCLDIGRRFTENFT